MATVSPSGNTTAAVTYTPIETNTFSSTQTTITFSSIAGTYKDLVLICNVQRIGTAENPSLTLRFNGDTGNNYSMTHLLGNGTTASSNRNSSQNMMNLSYFSMPSSNSFAPYIINIMNYANATTYKSVVSRGGAAGSGTQATVGLWRSTAAITSVTITNDGSPYGMSSGSTFTLYGIGA